MTNIDPRHTTKGTIYVLGISICFLLIGFFYQIFFNTKSIEVPIRLSTNFDDIQTIIKPNRYKLQATDTLSNFIIEKPTAYENLVCNTDILCAFDYLIFIVIFIPWFLVEMKLYNKGVFNVDISKLIYASGFLIIFVVILVQVQNHLIRQFVFQNTEGIYHPKSHNIFLPLIVSFILVLFNILSRTYKRAYDLKQQQDLTI